MKANLVKHLSFMTKIYRSKLEHKPDVPLAIMKGSSLLVLLYRAFYKDDVLEHFYKMKVCAFYDWNHINRPTREMTYRVFDTKDIKWT